MNPTPLFTFEHVLNASFFFTMNSLQIPDSSPSRVSRPVSVSVSVQSPSQSQSQSHAQSQSQSQSRRQQRASHQVISPTHQSQSDEAAHANSPAYRDVYSHPAAVAYATAHPRRTIPKFGPYLLLQTLGEGEFGKVKLGLHCQWGEEVAVKLIRRGSVDSSLRMSKVEREIEVLRVRRPSFPSMPVALMLIMMATSHRPLSTPTSSAYTMSSKRTSTSVSSSNTPQAESYSTTS